MDRKKRPARALRPILIQLVIDAAALAGAAALDSKAAEKAAASEAMGHAAPAWTIVAFLVFGAITAVVAVVSLVRFIKALAEKRRSEGLEEDLSDYR